MKKLTFLLLSALTFTFFAGAPISAGAGASVSAEEAKNFYAKIGSNTYLYSQAVDSEDYRVFQLPATYFVLLTGQANDDFYICRYADVMGYVKVGQVSPMDGVPMQPYVDNATFMNIAPDGIDMRSAPRVEPLNSITRVQFMEKNLYYYGPIEGREYVPGWTNIWYYAKLSTETQKQFGYLYSGYCLGLEFEQNNAESFPAITTPLFPKKTETSTGASKLSGTATTLIVIGVCLPCLVILYLLIKPTLISNPDKKVKHKVKRRRGDYYEFDESDLN